MQYRTLLALSGASFICAAGVAIAAVDGPVGVDAEKGDPTRWDQPADTPQRQHENAMKEAAAALAESLKECPVANREACEAQAREQYELELEHARGFLVPSKLG